MERTEKFTIVTFDRINHRKLRSDICEEKTQDSQYSGPAWQRAADKWIFEIYMYLGISFESAKDYFRTFPTYIISKVNKRGLSVPGKTRITAERVDELAKKMYPGLMNYFLDECPYDEEKVEWLKREGIPTLLKTPWLF